MTMMMNIKAATHILKKICTANTLFSSIILTVCNVNIIIIDTIKIRIIIKQYTINDENLEWLKFGGFGKLIELAKPSSANLL